MLKYTVSTSKCKAAWTAELEIVAPPGGYLQRWLMFWQKRFWEQATVNFWKTETHFIYTQYYTGPSIISSNKPDSVLI